VNIYPAGRVRGSYYPYPTHPVDILNPNDLIIEQAIKFGFNTSNNQAAYKTLVVGLTLTRELNVKIMKCHSDLQLVKRQIKKMSFK